MNRLAFPQHKSSPYLIVAAAFVLYGVLFALYQHRVGFGIASLAIIPVIGAGWYFGMKGGIFIALLSVLLNTIILLVAGQFTRLDIPSDLAGSLSLLIIGIVVGWLGTAIRERKQALDKLEKIEADRHSYTDFLELLNDITGMALKADSLNSTLKIMIEKIAELFEANDAFFSIWDQNKKVPLPMAAHGSMSDIYPYMQFEPGEITLATSVMEAQKPIAIKDIENSAYISPKIAAIFPSRSMLGLPLIAQQRNLGALLLGYNKTHSFDDNEIMHAQVTAEQVAQVLAKSLLLEEERKRVKQLTALHDISQISIEVDNEDELINRVTDVIGQNLFPDNFGVLLLDEASGMLKAHYSYRFFTTEDCHVMDLPIEKG